MLKIKIGADELILWLRKNKLANTLSNDDLGKFIRTIIEQSDNNNSLILNDQIAFWDYNDNARNINSYSLPKTAAQYEINLNSLPNIYKKLLEINTN